MKGTWEGLWENDLWASSGRKLWQFGSQMIQQIQSQVKILIGTLACVARAVLVPNR